MHVATQVNEMMVFMEDPTSLVISKKISDDLEKALKSVNDIRGASDISFVTSPFKDDGAGLIKDLGAPCFSATISLYGKDGNKSPIPSVKASEIVLHVFRKSSEIGVVRYVGATESYKFADWNNFFPSLINEIVHDLTRERVV